MAFLKQTAAYLTLVLVALAAVCVFRALVYFPQPKGAERCEESARHSAIGLKRGIFERFQRALQFKTITRSKGVYDAVELTKFTDWIESSEASIPASAVSLSLPLSISSF